MISHLTITVDESGRWMLDAGDVLFHRTDSVYELLLEVKGYLDKLAYFPTGTGLPIDPIPFDKLDAERFRREKREGEKEKRERTKAEAHLNAIRQEPAPESAQGPLPPH